MPDAATTRRRRRVLTEAGPACAPLGFSRDETDVEADVLDLRGKKAVVFLGVGGRRERERFRRRSIDFDGAVRAGGRVGGARDALRAFVESGGVFVVNGSGEHAERAFAWFGLPWRFANERARGEYEPNVEACDAVFGERLRLVSESRGSATLRAWARGERGLRRRRLRRRRARSRPRSACSSAWAPRRSVRKKEPTGLSRTFATRARWRRRGSGSGWWCSRATTAGGRDVRAHREPRVLAAGRDARVPGEVKLEHAGVVSRASFTDA